MLQKEEAKCADQNSVDMRHLLPRPKLTEEATAAYPVPGASCQSPSKKLPQLLMAKLLNPFQPKQVGLAYGGGETISTN